MDFDIIVSEESLAEIKQATQTLSLITAVNSDAGARAADSFVKPAKTLVKIVHDQRMTVTRRIDAAKKAMMAREAEICADLNAEIERVSNLCAAYLTEKARQQEEALRAERERIAKEQAEAEAEARAEAELTGADIHVPTVAAAPTEQKKVVDGVSARTTWTFTVVDAEAVPRAYCVPDNALIRAYMVEAKKSGAKIEDLKIPGVLFSKQITI